MTAAPVPSIFEPAGVSRCDGKLSNGVSISTWSLGQALVWDATYPDIFAICNVPHATREADLVAKAAEANKRRKLQPLVG